MSSLAETSSNGSSSPLCISTYCSWGETADKQQRSDDCLHFHWLQRQLYNITFQVFHESPVKPFPWVLIYLFADCHLYPNEIWELNSVTRCTIASKHIHVIYPFLELLNTLLHIVIIGVMLLNTFGGVCTVSFIVWSPHAHIAGLPAASRTKEFSRFCIVYSGWQYQPSDLSLSAKGDLV